ncbi:unnamed protein product, partial [Amoebophrya sp. A120]|eukprot:GSA120T00024420001.1
MSTRELIREVWKVVGNAAVPLKEEALEEIAANYVVTPDNFLKMIRVALRAEARMPVILVGETGCGKTSLLQTLAKILGVQFLDLPVHAGIGAKDILDFVERADNLARNEASHAQEVWVFLDEINTCAHQGVIADVMVDRRLRGYPLAENLVFLAAANPYRLREEKKTSLSTSVQRKFANLVYSVHPLPEKLMLFMYDFGKLGPAEEEQYVRIMCKGLAQRLDNVGQMKFWWKDKSGYNSASLFCTRFKSLFGQSSEERTTFADDLTRLLWVSQKFITERFPNYLVSLRDIKRCVELIYFLVHFYKTRETILVTLHNENVGKQSYKGEFDLPYMLMPNILLLSATLFGLMMCYHSRIPDAKQRREYRRLLQDTMRTREKTARSPQHEKMVELMRLPPDVVVTNTLAENIYVSVIGLLNRDPVYLVGKPGMSKSLALNIIDSNLKGKESYMPFWQYMPKLYVVSYQGSDVSNSAGIERRFQQAQKMQQSTLNFSPKDTIVLFHFDEIGLAEQSPNNPLKVLHSWLEPAQSKLRKPEFAFVALSNDQLDAAKMSRGLTINLPMPEPADLRNIAAELLDRTKAFEAPQNVGQTAKAQYCKEKVRDIMVNSYRGYYLQQKMPDFHGLRDFYFFVKSFCSIARTHVQRTTGPSQHALQLQPANYLQFLFEAAQRNFGGLTSNGEKSEFLQCLQLPQNDPEFHKAENQMRSFTLPEMLAKNFVAGHQARHLLLVCKSTAHYEIALDLVRLASESHGQPCELFVGSVFPKDAVSESASYASDVLNRFMHCMESGTIAVLRDLDVIYGSLFHVLNMNYERTDAELRCRIALADIHKKVVVHPKFRCVILLDDPTRVDVAFLNRAEKH